MTAGNVRTLDTADATEILDPEDQNPVSRRKVFAMCSLGVLGAAGLAACSSGTDTADPADLPTADDPTDDGSTPTTGSGAATKATVGKELAKLSDVPVGGSIVVKVGSKSIVVSQPTEGKAVAFSAVCPHQGGIVAPKGDVLKCPLHGSTFEEATGKNLSGPAAGAPLPSIATKVVKGTVHLKA